MASGLLAVPNLIFLIPLATGTLLVLLTAFSGVHAGRGAHGGRVPTGGGHGRVPAGGGHSGHSHTAGGHSGVRGHSGGVRGGHGRGGHGRGVKGAKGAKGAGRERSFLGALGIERAPLPVLLWGAMIGWGFSGFWANQILHPPLPVAAGIATGGSLVLAWGTAALISRLMPPEESSAVSRSELLGLPGTAIFGVTETTGRIHVYDASGSLHEEACRLEPGQSPIEKGGRVLLVDYDEARRLFLVEKLS